MCGAKPCRKCDRIAGMRRKSKTMARRKMSGGGITKNLAAGAGVGLGMIGGSMLVKQVGILSSNPLVGGAAQFVLGSFVMGMGGANNKLMQGVGMGLMGNGVLGVINQVSGGAIGYVPANASYQPGSALNPGVFGGVGARYRLNGGVGAKYPQIKVS